MKTCYSDIYNNGVSNNWGIRLVSFKTGKGTVVKDRLNFNRATAFKAAVDKMLNSDMTITAIKSRIENGDVKVRATKIARKSTTEKTMNAKATTHKTKTTKSKVTRSNLHRIDVYAAMPFGKLFPTAEICVRFAYTYDDEGRVVLSEVRKVWLDLNGDECWKGAGQFFIGRNDDLIALLYKTAIRAINESDAS